MAVLNGLTCLQTVGNTGNPKCYFDPGFISGAILAPTGAIIDPALNSGNLLTTMSALFYNASKAGRYYPLYDFEKPTDSSDKLVLQSMPNGAEHAVREGYNKWMFQYFDGGLTKHNNVRLFNGTNWDFFFLSTDLQTGLQQLIGIADSSGTKLQAIPCNPGGLFWAQTWGLNTGTEKTNYSVQFSYSQRYANTKGVTSFLTLPFTMESALPGLTDVAVKGSATVNATAKHFNITLTNDQGVDIGAVNSVALAVVGAWKGAASATPTLPYTISSVTWVPAASGSTVPGYFDILVAATNYATPPATSIIDLAAPAALAALGVDIESTGGAVIASV